MIIEKTNTMPIAYLERKTETSILPRFPTARYFTVVDIDCNKCICNILVRNTLP